MPDGLHHVAGARLPLGADHCRSLTDAPQGLPQVPGPADKGDLELTLVNVVLFVGGGQDLALVNEIHPQRFQNLRFHEMADAAFGHHRDGDGLHNLQNLLRVGHAGHAALGANIRGHPLQGHHRTGTRLFGDPGLLGVRHIHNDSALQHLGQTPLDRFCPDFPFHFYLLTHSEWLESSDSAISFYRYLVKSSMDFRQFPLTNLAFVV
jgi:hypothetical protein